MAPVLVLEISGHGVLKLAEQKRRVEESLKEYIEKKGAPAKGPVSRKLLELAESPSL